MVSIQTLRIKRVGRLGGGSRHYEILDTALMGRHQSFIENLK
jgi:hypothetical protein